MDGDRHEDRSQFANLLNNAAADLIQLISPRPLGVNKNYVGLQISRNFFGNISIGSLFVCRNDMS